MALTRANLAVVAQAATNTHKWKLWLYESAGDALATILGAGYFGAVVAEEVIETNDLILCIGTDGVTLGRFTAVTAAANIVVSDLSTGGGAQAAIADADADVTGIDIAASTGTQVPTKAEHDALAGVVNDVLAALRAAGIIAT